MLDALWQTRATARAAGGTSSPTTATRDPGAGEIANPSWRAEPARAAGAAARRATDAAGRARRPRAIEQRQRASASRPRAACAWSVARPLRPPGAPASSGWSQGLHADARVGTRHDPALGRRRARGGQGRRRSTPPRRGGCSGRTTSSCARSPSCSAAMPQPSADELAFRRERWEGYKLLEVPAVWEGMPEATPIRDAAWTTRSVTPGRDRRQRRRRRGPRPRGHRSGGRDEIEPGEILVCHTTDPSWASLFLFAGAVVIDIGGADQPRRDRGARAGHPLRDQHQGRDAPPADRRHACGSTAAPARSRRLAAADEPVQPSAAETAKTLSVEAIVDAAPRISETEGYEAISMRRLADEFGVTAMALYGYVSTKQHLLELVADRYMAELDLAEDVPDWEERLAACLSASFYELLVARPVLAHVLTHQTVDAPSAYRMVGGRDVDPARARLRRRDRGRADQGPGRLHARHGVEPGAARRHQARAEPTRCAGFATPTENFPNLSAVAERVRRLAGRASSSTGWSSCCERLDHRNERMLRDEREHVVLHEPPGRRRLRRDETLRRARAPGDERRGLRPGAGR